MYTITARARDRALIWVITRFIAVFLEPAVAASFAKM